MTFAEWQASKKLVPVEDEGVSGYCFADDTKQCWLYAGGLVIECRPGGDFLLQLPMELEEADEIEPLERRLFEFGTGEGCIEA
jgi:hypothetical protein